MKGLFLKSLREGNIYPRSNPKKLILFFNGWSLDENIVKHLTSTEYDVLMFYDYSNLDIDEDVLKEINSYEEINIIAWSFGVWACGTIIEKFNNLKNVIAINGTLIPIDNNFGIPEKLFNLTLSNLSETTYPKFFKNMFADSTPRPNLSLHPNRYSIDLAESFPQGGRELMPKRSIENQKFELMQIKKNSIPPPPLRDSAEGTIEYRSREVVGVGVNIKNINLFTKVFIGTTDKIICAKNQINYWEGVNDKTNAELRIIKKDSGHYMFNLFKSWDEIIND